MILFAGDAHGDFVPLIEEAGETSAVVLAFVGRTGGGCGKG